MIFFSTKYQNYIPKIAVPFIDALIKNHHFDLKIVNQRQSKHGDFRKLSNGNYQITVNNNLNKHQFLLTLVHEIAHYVTYQKFGKVKPHGKEWKSVFKNLMLPFIKPEIFPKDVLPYLTNYLINPKASTDSDLNLSLALKGSTPADEKCFVFALSLGSLFVYKNNVYKREKKRRTRIECLNLSNKKIYLFNQNVEVKLYEKE